MYHIKIDSRRAENRLQNLIERLENLEKAAYKNRDITDIEYAALKKEIADVNESIVALIRNLI